MKHPNYAKDTTKINWAFEMRKSAWRTRDRVAHGFYLFEKQKEEERKRKAEVAVSEQETQNYQRQQQDRNNNSNSKSNNNAITAATAQTTASS